MSVNVPPDWKVHETSTPKRTTRLPDGPQGPYDNDMEKRVKELEQNYLQAAVSLASIKAKVDDMPSKDWVHLRLWAVAAFIVAAVGLMIRFIPAAS